jgi:23S rRNA A2030 N6-methylase RlmJ
MCSLNVHAGRGRTRLISTVAQPSDHFRQRVERIDRRQTIDVERPEIVDYAPLD